MDAGSNRIPTPTRSPCHTERSSSLPSLAMKPLAPGPAVHLLLCKPLAEDLEPPAPSSSPSPWCRRGSPPSSAPLAGHSREIHFTRGSFIHSTIKAQGWDPSRRQESDLPADGFIISQAQQFGLNKTKPLLLMKTPLMSRAREEVGGEAPLMGSLLSFGAGVTLRCPSYKKTA